jgi:hypothetical protein
MPRNQPVRGGRLVKQERANRKWGFAEDLFDQGSKLVGGGQRADGWDQLEEVADGIDAASGSRSWLAIEGGDLGRRRASSSGT